MSKPIRNRYFNVAGPCVPGKHYMVNPLRGIGDELMDLINQEHYYVIHAARQSGKTTLICELTDRINAEGEYHAVYCNLESVQVFSEPERGIPAIVERLRLVIRDAGMPDSFAADSGDVGVANVLRDSLSVYCRSLDKPLVIFFDEADCLSDDTLITFLRQLRDGYIARRNGSQFVQSIALVGMRNIRDYKARIRHDSMTLGSASPFYIMTEAFNLRNFTTEEVAELYAQHTAETGQVFEQPAVDYVFEQTQGQPWLVNSIARECVEKITKKDYAVPITQNMVEQAVKNIILARGTHVDSLLERLKEPRVCRIITQLITGGDVPNRHRNDDYLFVRDLGLIRDDRDSVEPANPIYAELIVRDINSDIQETIRDSYQEYAIPRYLKNGRLDIDYLLKDFQSFWRENSEIIWDDYEDETLQAYKEAFPHIVLQAFLQRVVNGGGRVIRELALGRKRADLCVVYGGENYPIELKIKQSIRNDAKVLDQILGYMDKLGSNVGWLVIFDKDAGKSWDEKIYMREEAADGKRVTVVGC